MKKKNVIDILIYIIFIFIMTIDLFNYWDKVSSIAVLITFFVIGIASICLFIKDKGFLTIDKMIYIFIWVFGYYTPLHQYTTNTVISESMPFTDEEYLLGNFLIILFMCVYFIFRYYYFRKKDRKIVKNKEKNFYLSLSALILITIISLFCLLYLYFNKYLFSSTIDSTYKDSLKIIIIKMIRFFPVTALLIYIYSRKNNVIKNKFIKWMCLGILCVINIIIYFPLNGTISRYLLFGTYLMIIASLFEKCKRKSLILLATFLGFYFIFPAFNFFKTHTILEIEQFSLGGFDADFIDYDAYQMFLTAIRYVKDEGITYGMNILSAILCFIPRQIFIYKSLPSGQMIAEARGYAFTNLSCPLFAEFYLAGKSLFIVVGTAIFAVIVKKMEKLKEKNNDILFKGFYYIGVGMALPYMRGALLPMTSFLFTLYITYFICYMICKCFIKSSREGEKNE